MTNVAGTLNYQSYTPVGDILVLALVCIFVILIRAAYIKPNREFNIFKNILAILTLAAVSNILYHIALSNLGVFPNIVVYIFRFLYHLFLFSDLALYVLYMESPLQLTGRHEKKYSIIAACGVAVFSLLDVLGTLFRFGFYIESDMNVISGSNYFAFEYIFFVGILLYVLLRYKDRVYKPIIAASSATVLMSLFVMFVQGRHHQQSFTTATFIFPAFTVLYLLHSNPYDPEMGTLRLDSFEASLSYATVSKNPKIVLSLFMHEFEDAGRKYPKEIRDTIREYSENYFKNATLFQISGGRMILVADIQTNPDYEQRTDKILSVFKDQYHLYRHDFKIVITRTFDSISDPDDYINLIQYVENRMQENEIKFVDEKVIEKFHSHKYIVDELADINAKKDLFDKRVVVYCQPVYNLRTRRFDTAEALMRLKLDKTGMVFPDRFIPIAEKHNYVHMLSLIILARTCRQIKQMLEEGYEIKRISVNFSIMDVREKLFCENVKNIVEKSGIPFDKVAIEITESQNESDFSIVKEKITELKESGITFYLDDFGTGYSNFERIMELPFDIIKFDRSLVIASNSDSKSETMVSYLAHMFTDMNYAVLYEGIEDEKDESLCTGMYARYLQGYKYSKPIPIEQLTEYFVKNEKMA